MTRKLPLGIVVGALAAFAFAAPAVAVPIDYSLTGTGSGMLDGTSFMGEPFTISLTADSGNIGQPFPGFPNVFLNTGTATLTVDGMTDTLPNTAAAVNQTAAGGVAGFSAATGANLALVANLAFASYTLGFIGPTPGPLAFPSEILFPTGSGGSFELASTNGDATFSAVPLPATLPLFASGLGALGLLARRRKRLAPAAA